MTYKNERTLTRPSYAEENGGEGSRCKWSIRSKVSATPIPNQKDDDNKAYLQILKTRLVKGEISEEEFERKIRHLTKY